MYCWGMDNAQRDKTDRQEKALAAVASWRRRSEEVEAQRDPVITEALESGLSKELVHQFSGVARTTIDRIIAKRERAVPGDAGMETPG